MWLNHKKQKQNNKIKNKTNKIKTRQADINKELNAESFFEIKNVCFSDPCTLNTQIRTEKKSYLNQNLTAISENHG